MKMLLLIGLFTVSTVGQTQNPPRCTRVIDDLPALQGVTLRMPESEVLKLGLIEKPVRSGVGTRNFVSVRSVSIPGAKDRPAFSLVTYDQKVFSVVVYDKGISANIDEFVLKLSKDLNLPPDEWFKHSTSRIISCADFEITVNPTPNLLTLLDIPAFKKVVRAPQSPEPNRRGR